MSALTLETLALVLICVVPGLIITWVRSQFLDGRIKSNLTTVLSYISVSFIYNVFAYPIIAKQFKSTNHFDFLTWIANDFNSCIWLLVIIAIPAFIGFLCGLEAQYDCIYKLLRKFGLNIVHPIQTAWNWKFRNFNEHRAIITFTNGDVIGGCFGKRSFISSNPDEKDLYIAKIYNIKDDGTWNLIPRRGILIAAGEVSSIEFIGRLPTKETHRNEQA